MPSHPIPSARDEPPVEAPVAARRLPSAERVRAGLRAGLVASAATAGAMVGFAWRAAGGAFAPFSATGRMLLGVAAAESRGVQLAALVAGVAFHVVLVAAWTVLFSLVAGALRGVRLAVAAALFAAAAYVASEGVLPPLLRLGHGVRAFPPQVALLYVVLGLGLAIGMRIALPDRRRDGVR